MPRWESVAGEFARPACGHSQVDISDVGRECRICRPSLKALIRYPDPTAFDRKHHHYDPKSDPEKPSWFMVDVQLKRRLKRIIILRELREHSSKELNDMVILRTGNRLSVTPVSSAHWRFILSLERSRYQPR